MIQFIYLSERAERVCDEDVLDGIVIPSIRRNEAEDITGCLWFGKGHFLQVIEGPEAAVRALYARIERDQRHRNVRLLLVRPITDRQFMRSAMRYIQGPEMPEIERVVAEFGAALPTPSGVALVDASRAGTPRSSALQTILTAVQRLAFWRSGNS